LGEPLRFATYGRSLASGYPLHHLRPHRFAVRASVVPLLSLSLRPLRGQNMKYEINMSATLWTLFEILQNLCYLCAYVPKISLNQFEILKNQCYPCAKLKKNEL
jgi:hypothetical protein